METAEVHVRQQNVLIVSSKWPDADRSGVSLTAAMHADILSRAGFSVHILGPQGTAFAKISCKSAHTVKATGSGALYSPARVDRLRLRRVVEITNPDFLIVEGWQAAICEASIHVAHELQLPTVMISHGISLKPFSSHWLDRLRALGWMQFSKHALPSALRKISAITSLDLYSPSSRFLDRDLAQRTGTPIFELTNSAVHEPKKYYPYSQRGRHLVNVGYYSRVKNQLGLIRHLTQLPATISLRLIGKKSGHYFRQCEAEARKLHPTNRVEFLDDTECDIAEEIAKAKLYVSCSITEALPVTLLEAIAAGTPFVALDVGATRSLSAGGLVTAPDRLADAVQEILANEQSWVALSSGGQELYRKRYCRKQVERQLLEVARFASDRAASGRRAIQQHRHR